MRAAARGACGLGSPPSLPLTAPHVCSSLTTHFSVRLVAHSLSETWSRKLNAALRSMSGTPTPPTEARMGADSTETQSHGARLGPQGEGAADAALVLLVQDRFHSLLVLLLRGRGSNPHHSSDNAGCLTTRPPGNSSFLICTADFHSPSEPVRFCAS